MKRKKFLKLPLLDQLKYIIKESLKDHERFTGQYWKGSAYMGESILDAIKEIKQINKAKG